MAEREIHPYRVARGLRRAMTPTERRLWVALRDRRFAGAKFRRQHPLGGCVVDFCCPEAKLVVELDGSVHDEPQQRGYDEFRDAYLAELGYTILRFRNDEVDQTLPQVLQRLAAHLASTQSGQLPELSHPSPPAVGGEGPGVRRPT